MSTPLAAGLTCKSRDNGGFLTINPSAPATARSAARVAELSSAPAVLEIGTPVSWARKKLSSHWVRGPRWDGFWILSALWLAPIVLLLAHGYSNPESSPLDLLYFGLTALFWIGHRLSSTYLAYCTEAYRPLLHSQPFRFVVLPLLITAGCFALFLPADSALPWTREERLIGLAIFDYAWVTYHFAAQHFGALSLYRSRAGRTWCIQTRRLDRFFALIVGGVLVFVADILAGAVAYQDQWIDRWSFLTSIVSAQDGIRVGATLALLIATAIMLWAELRTPRWSLPRVLYIVGIAIMVGLALRPRSLFLFLVIWTSQHWILATGLASQTPCAEPIPAAGGIRWLLHRLNVRPWTVVLFLMLISIVLLPIFEVEANRESGTYYGDRIFGAFATQLRTSTWVPALLALGFATGFIHYLLDRSVYRMSDPQVRAAASGLVGNAARGSRRKLIRELALVLVVALFSVSSVHAQIGTPAAAQQAPLKAIYAPKPVYRPEWAKQGLKGKGVVLVTIDQQTGKVTGARMLHSTGNKLLDGAALEAYAQWRFQPGSPPQVKIPIEFATRPKAPAAKPTGLKPAILYPLLILVGFGVAVFAMRGRRRGERRQ
jgi:TonB family protein